MRRLTALRDAVLWPFCEVGARYCSAAQKHPFAVGVLTTGLKTSAADLFAQKARAGFGAWGGLMQWFREAGRGERRRGGLEGWGACRYPP